MGKPSLEDIKNKLTDWINNKANELVLRNIYRQHFPCKHINIKQEGDSQLCVACEEHTGNWWCPKSPDHHCYYYSHHATYKEDRRVVFLQDGREFGLSKDHNKDNESEDWCIFCGQPDERKQP